MIQGGEPAGQAARARVWVGEPGHRADRLADQAPTLAPSLRYAYVTVAALDPGLADPLPIGDLDTRAARLDAALA